MQLTTLEPRHHPSNAGHTLIATSEGKFCGETRCDGSCGYSALVLPMMVSDTGDLVDMKAHSNKVAVGYVWQRFLVPWRGKIVRLPAVRDDASELSSKWF